jgi:hypothetical protein
LPDPEVVPPFVPVPPPIVPADTWKGWSPIDPLAFKRLPDLRLPGLNPAQPWGLQQMYTPTDLNQFLQGFSTVGPIAPNVR